MKSPVPHLILLFPRPVHRAVLRTAWLLRHCWRRFRHRPAEGCAVIIENDEGHILLVRHSYVHSDFWMLPGGKMKRQEPPVVAAQREMNEEINCRLTDLRLLEYEDAEFWGRRHTTYIVTGICRASPEPDLREIEEAAFFPLSALPEPINDPTRARLERWRVRNSIPFAVPPFVRVDYVRERILA